MAGRGLHAAPPPRPPHHDYFGQSGSNPGNQLYVGNVSGFPPPPHTMNRHLFKLPYQAGWQDLKDLFRSSGNIIRADINIGADGRPKGSGTVIFETAKDAQQAITMYHGFDWYGRTLEVREVSLSQHKDSIPLTLVGSLCWAQWSWNFPRWPSWDAWSPWRWDARWF